MNESPKPKRCSTGCSARSTRRPTRIVVVDRIGREVVRNAAAQRFRGARHGEVLAEERVDGAAARRRSPGQVAERELQLYGPPRQVLHLRAFPLRRDGEVVGAVAFTRDISEARRVESVRRDFVANVSHELKTPIGALGLLAETMAATDDVARRAAARRASRARGRPAGADRRRPARPQHDRSAGSAVARAVPGRLLVSEAVDLVQAAADTAGVPLQRRAAAARRRDPRATTASCGARS